MTHGRALPACFKISEQKPQPQLDLPRSVARWGSRCSDARDPLAARVEGGERLGLQVRIVQDIEHLHPELGLQLLAPQVLVSTQTLAGGEYA
jgi:hypothetical protein